MPPLPISSRSWYREMRCNFKILPPEARPRRSRSGSSLLRCAARPIGVDEVRRARDRAPGAGRRPFTNRRAMGQYHAAGWSSLVARRAHNPKVRGSNPLPATNKIKGVRDHSLTPDFCPNFAIEPLLGRPRTRGGRGRDRALRSGPARPGSSPPTYLRARCSPAQSFPPSSTRSSSGAMPGAECSGAEKNVLALASISRSQLAPK